MFRLNVLNIMQHSVMLYNMTSSYYTLCNHLCLLSFTGSGRKYQLYAIHTSKACNILSKYTAFIPIDLDTNEYLQTCIEYINPSKSSRISCGEVLIAQIVPSSPHITRAGKKFSPSVFRFLRWGRKRGAIKQMNHLVM